MKMWIAMVFTLLALVSMGYCQDQEDEFWMPLSRNNKR